MLVTTLTPLVFIRNFYKSFTAKGLIHKLPQSLYHTKLQKDAVKTLPLFGQQQSRAAHMEEDATCEQRSYRSNDVALQHV